MFGALTPSAEIDLEACRCLLAVAGDLETTFHRAIDAVQNPLASLAQLESLGFDRVLTSGQQPTAREGAKLIAAMVQQSATISIMPGSGIEADNALQLVQQTGVREIHASASILQAGANSRGTVSVGEFSFGKVPRVTSAEKVSALKRTFD